MRSVYAFGCHELKPKAAWSMLTFGWLAVMALGGVLLLLGAPASGVAAPSESEVTTVTRVTAIAGKPTEMRFSLSRRVVPKSTVVFRVVNKGTIIHDFKIAGKKTRIVQPGGSVALKVSFVKARRYPYLCTVPGHAAAGMKGVLVVR